MMTNRFPPEFHDLQVLCDKVEAAECRYDARTARGFICSLPNELLRSELIQIVKEFVCVNFVEQGLGVVTAIHEGKTGHDLSKYNPHAHILVTTRTIGPDGFSSKKDREHDKREYIDVRREQWAAVQNMAYERSGLDIRVSHKSLKAQGEFDLEPTLHLSPAEFQKERAGQRTPAVDRYHEIQERNKLRQQERTLLLELERELCVERSR